MIGRPVRSGPLRGIVLGLLGVDGVLSAVAGALLLPARIGSVAFPVSALICGLLNAALVWAASQWTSSPRWAALPLWTWLATVVGLTLGGPGGDNILGGTRVLDLEALLFLALGVLGPAAVLWRLPRGAPADPAPSVRLRR